MLTLDAFSTPGKITDSNPEAWSNRVAELVAFFARDFPQFYNPLEEETPADAQVEKLWWRAFPLRIIREGASFGTRWQRADASRDEQDEYCEWSVERNSDNKITRVTFTTEVREYWEHLAETNPDQLLELYRDLVSPEVEMDDLLNGGRYNPANPWNSSTESAIVHLKQRNNNLGAAVDLVAKATILREDEDGNRVTSRTGIVDCGKLGDSRRGSDPQIAFVVNHAAAQGSELTLEDPAGLYLEALQVGGFETPDGTDPLEFWTVERGSTSHCLRASFSVPDDLGYTVSDIEIFGVPILFGAQLADRVLVRVNAVVKPGQHQPEPQPCAG